MLDKNQIIGKVKAFCEAQNIELSDVVLVFGAAEVFLGSRTHTNDIDLSIPKTVIMRLIAEHNLVPKASDGDRKFYEFMDFDFALGDSDVPCLVIDGIGVQTIESIVRGRLKMGRPKDYKAIDALVASKLIDADQVKDLEEALTWNDTPDDIEYELNLIESLVDEARKIKGDRHGRLVRVVDRMTDSINVLGRLSRQRSIVRHSYEDSRHRNDRDDDRYERGRGNRYRR